MWFGFLGGCLWLGFVVRWFGWSFSKIEETYDFVDFRQGKMF